MKFSPDRRRVLALGVAAGAALAADAVLPKLALAKPRQATLEQCLAMTPEEMARTSPHVIHAMDYIKKTVATVKDSGMRSAVMAVLSNPAPTLLARMDSKVRGEVFQELTAKGYLKDAQADTYLPPAASPDRATQPFLATPGSGYQSHHSYPGGLVTHTAGNLKISLAIFETYRNVYGITLDRDEVVVSQTLHDLHKPWVFQWEKSGESRKENTLAGTGEHHVLSIAESIVRGLPASTVVAQACAHTHPGTDKDEAEVVGWIAAAAIIAGVDPVGAGLLEQGGKTLPVPRKMEGFITHLGDHDFVLTVPAAKWTIAALGDVARKHYGMGETDLKGPKFNALRNYAFSQATVEELYSVYATQGQEGLASAVTAMVKPA